MRKMFPFTIMKLDISANGCATLRRYFFRRYKWVAEKDGRKSMRKQVRQYLRRSLCGVLSAAMILTGSAISGMTVYAAQPDVENEGGGVK